MSGVTTMPELYWPLMEADSIKLPYCAVCGRTWPLNRHHVVFRSQGQLYRDGRRLEKPTVTLCGEGSVLYGTAPDGTRVEWCHGKAHHRRLHFRCADGRMQYLETGGPVKYQAALAMDGWRDLCR